MSKKEDEWNELARFIKDKFGVNPFPLDQKTMPEEKKGEEEPPVEDDPDFHFKFEATPKQVKNHLDKYVVKQEEAKKVLSIAVCDHYKHVQRCHREKNCGHYLKQNVVLIGPTGVGKTYLVKVIADLVGVPFVKADATKFSEVGYVGSDVEDLVRELVRKANGNVKLAQYGIVYLDEIDKIAGATEHSGRDVSGQGVQRGLLKLMEETEVPTKSPMDMMAQIQSVMSMGKGKKEPDTINTRHILFIVSGAFGYLKKIVHKRVQKTQIGFDSKNLTKKMVQSLLKEAHTKDFIQFGFEPEFIGRLPVRVACDELTEEDLYHILKDSEGSIAKQMIDAFKAYDIEVIFSDEGLREIACLAHLEKTGARGLITICEKTLRDYKFELPSSVVKRFVVSKELVDNPHKELQKTLKNPTYSEEAYWKEQLDKKQSSK